jgi:hypothetical protein
MVIFYLREATNKFFEQKFPEFFNEKSSGDNLHPLIRDAQGAYVHTCVEAVHIGV